MSPQVPMPQGDTSWHAVSPGIAICPGGQSAAGRIASQPPLPSGMKPTPQSAGGTPAGWQPPPSSKSSPGGQGMSGGSPAGWQGPPSNENSPGAHSAGPASGGPTGGPSPPPQPISAEAKRSTSAARGRNKLG